MQLTHENMFSDVKVLLDDATLPCLVLATEVPSSMQSYAEELALTYSVFSTQGTLHIFRGDSLDALTGWHGRFAETCTRLFVGAECLKPNVVYTAGYTNVQFIN
jgi:hypothetical protein